MIIFTLIGIGTVAFCLWMVITVLLNRGDCEEEPYYKDLNRDKKIKEIYDALEERKN